MMDKTLLFWLLAFVLGAPGYQAQRNSGFGEPKEGMTPPPMMPGNFMVPIEVKIRGMSAFIIAKMDNNSVQFLEIFFIKISEIVVSSHHNPFAGDSEGKQGKTETFDPRSNGFLSSNNGESLVNNVIT